MPATRLFLIHYTISTKSRNAKIVNVKAKRKGSDKGENKEESRQEEAIKGNDEVEGGNRKEGINENDVEGGRGKKRDKN